MRDNDELETTRNQLAAGVGHALAEWSIVEATMTFVFVSVLDNGSVPIEPGLVAWDDEDPSRRMSHTILNAIIGFEARVDVVSAVVSESDLTSDLKILWPGIGKRLKKKYKSRHEAAHFTLTNVEQEDGSCRAYLTPFATTVGSYSEKRLSLNDLEIKREALHDLRYGLLWFRSEVERQRGRLPEPPWPEPPLIQRVRQSLETQSPSASPSPTQSSGE